MLVILLRTSKVEADLLELRTCAPHILFSVNKHGVGAMQVVKREVATLRPYAQNARTHSRKQVKQIAASIERFGFTNPVLVSDDGEIIAGHGRVEAAKLLGITRVPTVALSHLSEAERPRVRACR